MYQNSQEKMLSVLNTNPILSVPNATGLPNVTTVPNVPKMTMNDPSLPKSYLAFERKTLKCTKHKMRQSALNVSKLTRNDA